MGTAQADVGEGRVGVGVRDVLVVVVFGEGEDYYVEEGLRQPPLQTKTQPRPDPRPPPSHQLGRTTRLLPERPSPPAHPKLRQADSGLCGARVGRREHLEQEDDRCDYGDSESDDRVSGHVCHWTGYG